jgi:hypothetical protein
MVKAYVKPWSAAVVIVAVSSGVAFAQSVTRSIASAPLVNANTPPPPNAGEPVRIEYSAPADCPNAGAFTARVLQQSKGARLAGRNELARVVHVELVHVGSEVAGEARVLRAGSTMPANLVVVGPCETVIEKLALFATSAGEPALRTNVALDDARLFINPYLNWRGPVSESIPGNPYSQALNDIGPAVPAAMPKRAIEPRVSPLNPYRF